MYDPYYRRPDVHYNFNFKDLHCSKCNSYIHSEYEDDGADAFYIICKDCFWKKINTPNHRNERHGYTQTRLTDAV